MRTVSLGKKLLRLLIFAGMVTVILAGCNTAEYDAVEQQISTEMSGTATGSEVPQTMETEETSGTSEPEPEMRVAMTVPEMGAEPLDGAADELPDENDGTEMVSPANAKVAAAAFEMPETAAGPIIALDAGYQAKPNAEKEPIGPGSDIMKAKMPEGATGTATGVKEYELTLTVAQKLEQQLKEQGYQVVMVRTGHDVNLSNAERAKIANESGADIFIRLYANSMENSGIYGAMAMCMTEYNPYNANLSADSYRLSKQIVDNICAQTGTKNRGVQKVDNSGIINWSEVPVAAVQMGFLTNPDEDRWLQEEDYQNKIVAGIAEAVGTYFAQ